MKKRIFDVAIIVFMVVLLLLVNQMDFLEKDARFAVIPFLAFYFFGKYSERKSQCNS